MIPAFSRCSCSWSPRTCRRWRLCESALGTLEQLNVTPIARWELILGKMLPYALIGLIDILLVVVVAVFWFEVPLRGSFALLLAMCLVYLLTTPDWVSSCRQSRARSSRR